MQHVLLVEVTDAKSSRSILRTNGKNCKVLEHLNEWKSKDGSHEPKRECLTPQHFLLEAHDKIIARLFEK